MEIELREMEHAEFREDWLSKHPASIPIEEVEDSPYPRWAKPIILIGFILASLLSGVHTMVVVYEGIQLSELVDELQRQWVARGSFIVYEIGMFAAAYLMGVQSTKRLAQLSAFIIFLTLIAANLYSVNEVYGFDLLSNFAGSFVTGLFALVPVLAYSFSKLYINIGNAERALAKRARDTKKEADKALDATINREHKKHQNEVRKAIQKARSLNSVNEQAAAPVQPLNTPNVSTGYTKQMNSRALISEFFERHPEFKNMTLDDLNKAIEQETGVRVGRTSIHNVRKEWGQDGYTNGRAVQ